MSSPSPPPKRIKFLRGLAEATDFDDDSFDLVVFSFVIHECPQVGAEVTHIGDIATVTQMGDFATLTQIGDFATLTHVGDWPLSHNIEMTMFGPSEPDGPSGSAVWSGSLPGVAAVGTCLRLGLHGNTSMFS